VLKESGRWKSRWRVRDLLVDGRSSQAVLDILSTTDVGSLVPTEEDAESERSEWELQERRGRGEERREEAEELGAAGNPGAGEELVTAVPTHALFHGIHRRGLGLGVGCTFFCSFFEPDSFPL